MTWYISINYTKQGIPKYNDSFVGWGLVDTLETNVALGQLNLPKIKGLDSNSNFLNCLYSLIKPFYLIF